MSTVHPILRGEPDPDELYSDLKPVRYRYVMAYLHDEYSGGVLHQAGEVMFVLPMTAVTYRAAAYSGTEFSGNIYLPDFYLDLMMHQPSNVFQRTPSPAQMGMPMGSMFECGNRALYVMRNDEVVWGGILWSRSYASGSSTMAITGLSFDGYAYYRLMRRSIVFSAAINQYTIWYAVLKQMLTDFTWPGVDTGRVTPVTHKKIYANSGMIQSALGEAMRIGTNTFGKIVNIGLVPWTGLTKNQTSNADAILYDEVWPKNSPHIELPPADLKLYSNPGAAPANLKEVTVQKEFRGYEMGMIGALLEEWADTKTILSAGGGNRFEYRVVCWYDGKRQIFRQRYVFGNMSYSINSTDDEPKPDGILSPYLGKNTQAMAKSPDNQLIFDFPGHISAWSLGESNDSVATRVIATDAGDGAAKHAEYASQKDLLNVPAGDGSQGWLLYDHAEGYDVTRDTVTTLRNRARTVLDLLHVGQAAQINDLAQANGPGKRSSERSTSFQVTLYTTPNMPFPKFEVGDWATFAIDDPFYGGKMYLVRRIMGYTITVVPEQESDYSHETIELDLTDDTQIDLGG